MSTQLDFAKLKKLYRDGKNQEVLNHLNETTIKNLPREERWQVAKICRQIGEFDTGIKILNPVMRDRAKYTEPPNPNEICEFAVLVAKVGATPEAMFWLSQVDPKDNPLANLYMGFVHVMRWEYSVAAHYFETFLNRNEFAATSDRETALLNLSACYLFTGDFENAEFILRDVEASLTSVNHERLRLNCEYLLAQTFALSERFDEALPLLKNVNRRSPENTHLSFGSQKWILYVEAKKEGWSLEIRDRFVKLREQTEAQHFYELSRDIDKYLGILGDNKDLLKKCYFGSPSSEYKKHILSLLPSGHSFGSSFIVNKINDTNNSVRVFHPSEGRIDKSEIFKKGQVVQKLVQALAEDLYVPQGVGTLFAKIFPGEYYDVESCTNRVFQYIFRINKTFEDLKIDIAIVKEDFGYRFQLGASVGLLLQQRDRRQNENFALRLLTDRFGKKPFSSSEASEALGTPKSSTARVVADLVERELISSTGKGKTTKYQIAKLR